MANPEGSPFPAEQRLEQRLGPVLRRRDQVQAGTTDQRLLDSEGDSQWVHTDPWRVMRIQSEFVEGFGALAELPSAISVFGSARQVEAEFAHPTMWRWVRRRVLKQVGTRLPRQPMRRHHYLYARGRYLTDPSVLAMLATSHRQIAAEQARELGLLDPDGPGSWTHPDLSRMLHADGKVITPLFRARPG